MKKSITLSWPDLEINKVVSLENDIGRYQETLKYARSTSDYSVGKGLCMLPSDLPVKPLNQVIEGYNDKIVVNTSGFELGKQHKPTIKQVVTKPTIKKPTVGRAVNLVTKPKRRPHTLDNHQDEVTSVVLAIGGLTLFGIFLK